MTDKMDDFFEGLGTPPVATASRHGLDATRQPGYAPAYPAFDPRSGPIVTGGNGASH